MRKYILSFALTGIFTLCAVAQDVVDVKRYAVPAAEQGVAVDKQYFYVINNNNITKHNKKDGKPVALWADSTGVIKHLNSGIIIRGKLYCTNSNYPESPMASSIEIFDPETLIHIGNHSFGILNGSATWIDQYEGYWYVGFAHYTGRGATESKDNRWTRLVKFDREWQQVASWLFPQEMIEAFQTRSNSGGFIDDDGMIYCTGHDEPVLYVLSFPKMGYTLQLEDTLPVANKGQGIALDDFGHEKRVYGIIRSENVVVVSSLAH